MIITGSCITSLQCVHDVQKHINQIFTKVVALEDPANWVDSHSSHMQNKTKHCRPLHEEQCDSSDKSDDANSIVPAAFGNKKHRGKVIKLMDEWIDLWCAWQDCVYCTVFLTTVCAMSASTHHVLR
jgi:hypothetical protein